MLRTLMTIALTVVGVLFALQNFDHVPVYIFGGKAVEIRLIFVIGLAVIAGYMIRYFIGMTKEEALKRRLNNVLRRARVPQSKLDEEEEDF
jgi:uncharacterized integral membrane protein